MSLPRISVIVPTVAGREDHFARCIRSYNDLSRGAYDLEFITENDHPSVGSGWQAGWERSSGDYIHLSNDDIEPRVGWHAAAVEAVAKGFLPAPQVYDPNGFPQSHPQPGQVGTDWSPVHMTALPFASREQMKEITPLLTSHYFSDDFFSQRGLRAGWSCRLRTGYAFTHHWAQHMRGAGMTEHQRMVNDERLFSRAMAMVTAGQWKAPWPSNGGRP